VSASAYRVLGEIAVDGDLMTRRRERELLGLLVAGRGRAVPAERILEEVWAAEAQRGSLQVAVSRLRTLLDPARSAPSMVETTPAGYRLAAASAVVDVWVFEDLAEQSLSATTPGDRLVLGTRAIELWAGKPYAECRAPSLRIEAARLEELHVTVQESRAEALLALGHPAAAVRLLGPVAPEHPYREQLWALLARAQYASARQADALATLATVRTRLAEDLGVDPSAAVRTMEQAILTQDPGLTPTAAPLVGRGHRVRRAVGRCRATGTGYVIAHTPLVPVRTAGTMTG
jgi:DNA-binding SARP family transcriptional activator